MTIDRGVFVVTGASSGLGWWITYHLNLIGYSVHNWSLDRGVDVTDENSLQLATQRLAEESISGLVNCAGINYIDWFEKITISDWDRVMNTNARGIFLTSQLLVNRLRGKVICNIVSNASHVPMTNSAAYNASKGAAAILTLQMARELKKSHNITIFGVSPNKMFGTKMSKEIETRVCQLRGWSREEAQRYQQAALPSGEETDPAVCGEFIAWILNRPDIYKYMNQTIIPFGA